MYPRIRDLREDSDRSQTELAKLLGMSQTGYSKYETGENDVPVAILEKLADHADIVIVSATSTEALLREWEEHRLLPLVSAVCGQEAGSKAECIARAMKGYAPSRCLMLGDAPGDAAAAGKNGILFYPIRPLEETDSWQEFYQEYLDAFLEERYEGELQRKAEELFRRLLTETPPWKQEAKRES